MIDMENTTTDTQDSIAPQTANASLFGQQYYLPDDLYIPPDALQIFLEAFEGPLDLLLYLIKRQNINILDIPIAKITQQYLNYVDLIKGLRFELAAEYLLMAATLAEIKSRMLLPRPPIDENEEDDPRAELVRRLQEYEQFKLAAENMDELPRLGRDVFQAQIDTKLIQVERSMPDLQLKDLLFALKDVLRRVELNAHHHVQFEPLSIRERMTIVLTKLGSSSRAEFSSLFDLQEGKIGVVVTFMAMLELLKQALIDIEQSEIYGRIYLKSLAVGT